MTALPAYAADAAAMLPLAAAVQWPRLTPVVRRVLLVFLAMGLQNLAMAVVAPRGANLWLAVPFVPVNLALWLWAIGPYLERSVYRHACLVAVAEFLSGLPGIALPAAEQLAVLVPAQAITLSAVGWALLMMHRDCAEDPACRAIGTFLVVYYGPTAFVWPAAPYVDGAALWWLFTVRAAAHVVAYVYLCWALVELPGAPTSEPAPHPEPA